MQNLNLKFKSFLNTFYFLLVFLTFTFLFLIFRNVLAISMDSDRYKIESASVSSAAGSKSSSGYKLSDTIGQLAAGQFSSTGYIVKAGFQYIHSIIPFRFSISDTSIDFDTLLPNTPKTTDTILSVYFGGAGQYQVTAIEEGKLRTLNNLATIPDTTCNGGANTCSESQAKIWTSDSTYGFGYSMGGDDIPDDFVDNTYYRHFPDRTEDEAPAVVMSSPNVGKNRQATMTFKSNISSIQPAGSYQTVINFVATPSY